VPQAGSFTAKKGRVVSHDMGGHVAAAVTYKQAGHVSPKSVPNPTVRIAAFIRYESPASEAAVQIGMSDVWRCNHTPTSLATAFIFSSKLIQSLPSNENKMSGAGETTASLRFRPS
jgi:hypothetical protein